MTEVIRSDSPDESSAAVFGILAVTLMIFVLTGVLLWWVVNVSDAFSPVPLGIATMEMSLPALWLTAIFFGMAAVLDLWRKHFIRDELVNKVRMQKVVPRREFK